MEGQNGRSEKYRELTSSLGALREALHKGQGDVATERLLVYLYRAHQLIGEILVEVGKGTPGIEAWGGSTGADEANASRSDPRGARRYKQRATK